MAVYIVRWGDYVKVGYSSDPIRRRDQMERYGLALMPEDLDGDPELIRWVEGDLRTEELLHEALAPWHVIGEFFRAEGPVADLLTMKNGKPRAPIGPARWFTSTTDTQEVIEF